MGGRGRLPALDGLRGVAILLVLAEHSDVPHALRFGTVGVQVFFVLSGYLITWLLLEERDQTGRLDLAAFALRRAARLVPALLLMVAVVVAIVGRPAVIAGYNAITYQANYHDHDWGGLHHTWSLAVEVHFYVLWALGLTLLPRRWVAPVAVTVAALSFGLRVDQGLITYGTETNLWAPMIGAWMAAAGWGPPGSRLLAVRPLVGLGRISYGVYLWHFPLLMIGPWPPLGRAIAVVVSVLIATVSYRLVERPAIRWAARRSLPGVHRHEHESVVRPSDDQVGPARHSVDPVPQP